MLLALALHLQPVLAADPEFADPADPAEVDPDATEKKLSAELGGTWATGNAMFYTFTGGLNGSLKKGRHQGSAVATGAVGSAVTDADGDGILSEEERDAGYVRNAQRVEGTLRYDFFPTRRGSVYGLVGAFTDPFAGYDWRAHQQVGYSRLVVDRKAFRFVAEGGADFAQEDYVEGVDPNRVYILAARVMLGIEKKFNDKVALTENVEAFFNLLDPEDLRLLNNLSVTATLSNRLALKFSHALAFDNVPVEGFQPLDQTLTVTLVASVL